MYQRNAPNKDIKTTTYYSGINRLLCSSIWRDEFGEDRKIPQGLKVYYIYRWGQYKIFESLELPYYEKHTTVAKLLGVSLDTIKRVYNPMLKQMGLIETKGSFKDNNVCYVVYSLDNLNGWFINESLPECKVEKKTFENTETSFTYDNLKTLEHNKRVSKRIRLNSEVRYSAIDHDRYRELILAEKELKRLSGCDDE